MRRFLLQALSLICLLIGALPVVTLAAQTSRGIHILYYEQVDSLKFEDQAATRFLGLQPSDRASARRASFLAFGRAFDLELEPNNRLLAQLSDATRRNLAASSNLFKGRLAGREDTWVRLTVVNGELAGVIWDGAELYAIEPADSVRLFAVQPVANTGSDPLIFRWSDVQFAPGALSCGTTSGTAALNGLQQYTNLVAELSQTFQAQSAAVPTSELNLGIVGDEEYLNFNGGNVANTEAAMMTRINTVDGIFSDQVGVQLNITETVVHDAASDPFVSSTDPFTLLSSFADYKAAAGSPILDEGLAHLFTGRNLDNNTVGIAFTAAVCQTGFAVGLTESRSGPTLDALTAAHEIGHNFGAPHDGDPNSACASEPPIFLMNPTLNGSSTFSPCSLNEMATVIAGASCITLLGNADLLVTLPTDPSVGLLGEDFDLDIRMVNIGGSTASGVTVTATLDSSLLLTGSGGSLGGCTVGAGSVDCGVADIPLGQERILTLRLSGSQVGSFMSDILATPTNEADPTNNNVTATITVDPAIDLTTAAMATPVFGRVGDTISLGWTVTNNATIPATDLDVDITVPSGLIIMQVTGDNCTINGQDINCAPAPLAPSASGNFTVDVQVNQVGSFNLLAVATSTTIPDINPLDNSRVVFLGGGERLVNRTVGLSGASPAPVVNSSFSLPFTVGNSGADDARDVVATITVPADMTISSATVNQGACSVAGSQITCVIGDITSGVTVNGTLNATSGSTGSKTVSASVAGNLLDVDTSSSDDSTQRNYQVASAGGGNNKGGGSTDPLLALALFALFNVRRFSASANRSET